MNRWTRWSGTVLCLAASATAAAQTCALQSQTVNLPLVSKATPKFAYQVRVQLGSDADGRSSGSQVLEVDTGSTGVVVPLSDALRSAWDASNTPGHIFYSSDSKYHPGKYVDVPMRLGVSADGKSAAARVDRITVLAAQCTCDVASVAQQPKPLAQVPATCAGYDGSPALSSSTQVLRNCSTISPNFGMMGVGYDRGVDAARNPFLNLVQMREQRMSPGYIVSARGITLGVSQAALQGFAMVPLQRGAATAGVPSDWQAPTACASFPGSGSDYRVCGKLLPDTGVSYMMLNPVVPPATPESLQHTTDLAGHPTRVVPDATQLRLDVVDAKGQPVFGYAFAVGDGKAATPDSVQWRGPLKTPPAHLNSGRHLLAAGDYAYDAACGHAGFRATQPGD
ncbi:hypothetical protein CEK69_05185 [Xanthomonas sp. LMG 12462]|uniref:hypothetical protein n=1 Tax=Xanthomonas sp. LMG 12462 TaxID=1591134 RepID=UPI0012658D90|nr:hypothetical protein [Xanthomonas sp. LMG 12462]KAB7773145.1 hypothetical protein CEK69_05185 [Xanthomonas sp. LMG 12462]